VTGERWHDVCALEDLVEGTGVGALVAGRQVAIFQVHGRVYALDNFDPASRANVLSRGLTGNLQGERVVALAGLQASLRADQRPLHRGSARST
jgi:nitrite reductase/ring-hydroxylating ferredoxin subunit